VPQTAANSNEKQSLKPLPDSMYCSLMRRLLVMFYDSVIMFGLLMLASTVALPIGGVEKLAFRDFWFTTWLFGVCFLYLAGCWRYGGMTVGMRAWKVRLLSADGQKLSWPKCLLRFFVGMVSLAAFGVGFLWALVDQKKRGWHDLAADTLLILTPTGAKP